MFDTNNEKMEEKLLEMRGSQIAEVEANNNGIENIGRYLVNDAWREANRDRVFTPEEQVALIVHSDSVPLFDRIKDLMTLRRMVSEDIAKAVEHYIDLYDEQLTKIGEYDRSADIVYNDVKMQGSNSVPTAYSTFNSMSLSADAGEHIVYIQRMTELSHTAELGRIHYVDGQIIKITMWSLQGDDDISKLFKLPVTLTSPFKPDDVIDTPFGMHKNIVADVSREEIESLTAECAQNEQGWLNVVIPVYDYERDSAKRKVVVKTHFSCGIEQIKKISDDALSPEDRAFVDFLCSLD